MTAPIHASSASRSIASSAALSIGLVIKREFNINIAE